MHFDEFDCQSFVCVRKSARAISAKSRANCLLDNYSTCFANNTRLTRVLWELRWLGCWKLRVIDERVRVNAHINNNSWAPLSAGSCALAQIMLALSDAPAPKVHWSAQGRASARNNMGFRTSYLQACQWPSSHNRRPIWVMSSEQTHCLLIDEAKTISFMSEHKFALFLLMPISIFINHRPQLPSSLRL